MNKSVRILKINKMLLILSLVLMPVCVFASSSDSDFPVSAALIMEAFVSIHMSLFVLKPLSEIISKKDSKKIFWILFSIRASILLFFDIFVTPFIAIVDVILVFIGAFILIPIYLATNIKKDKEEVRTQNSSKVLELSSNFDQIYSLPEEKMLEEFINRELNKVGIDKTSKLIPSEVLRKKKIMNYIFTILIFVYITLIFFHFPIYTYLIGIVLLFIFYKVTGNYNLVKYLKKEVKARSGEKISNIVMNVKNTFVADDTKRMFLVCLLVSVILPLIIFSQPKILYEKIDGGYAVRYYIFGLSNFKTATIPETYKNEKVVSLRGNTFSNMPFLESITLPNSIVEIRGQAFKNCKRLTEVNIPKNLEYLGGGAFYNAKSIKKIELPDTLTYLGGESFYGATSLEYIKLSNNLTEIRGDSFEYCTSLKSITIPDKVTRIGGHAFYGDSSLSEVVISENSKLNEIGSSAFRQCSSLYSITLLSHVNVNERAFKESPTTVNVYGYIDNDIDDFYDTNDDGKTLEDYYLEDYNKELKTSIHTNESSYSFRAGDTITFNKYDLIISVPRISKNGSIDYTVNARSKKYGILSVSYANSKERYVYWDGCRIDIVETGNLDELQVKISSVEELEKKYKTAVLIKLTQNERYLINNNTIGLTYKSHRTMGGNDEFDIMVDGVDSCNFNQCNSILLDKESKILEINDNFMIEYIDAQRDELRVKVYYN